MLHATALCWASLVAWTSKKTFIMERIYEDEIHEHTLWMFKDAIRIEWIHVDDNGCFFINSWRIKTALESYFEERAQETWERNLRNTTLLNTCNRILMETILKVLREQLKDDDQRKNSWWDRRLSTRNLTWMGSNLERTRRILERSTMDICHKIWCWLRARTRAKARGMTSPHAEELAGEIDEAGIRAVACDCRTGRDWWSTSRKCWWDESVCVLHKTSPWTQQGACSNHDVSEFVKQREIIWELKHFDISRTYFPGTMERLFYIWLPQKIVRSTNHLTRTWVELRMLHTSGSFGILQRNKHSAILFHNPNLGVRMTMQGDFEHLLEDDGLKHITTQIQRRSERQGRTSEVKDSNLNTLVMLYCDYWIRTQHRCD